MNSFFVANKGFIGKIGTENDNIIVVTKFRVDVNSKEINKSGKFRWTYKTKVEILTAANVEDIFTGISSPYIVIRLLSDSRRQLRQFCYILSIDLVADKVVPCRKFEYTVQLPARHDSPSLKSVYLFNGPSVIVSHTSKLSVYSSPKSNTLKSCSFDLLTVNDLNTFSNNCPECNNKNKIKTNIVLDNVFHKNKVLLFNKVSILLRCQTHPQQVKNLIHTLMFADETITLLNNGNFFPIEYIDCITCIRVKDIQISDDQYFSELYLGTLEGYIVHVINGRVKQCVNVFEDSPVEMLETGRLCSFKDNSFICGKPDTFVVLDNSLQIKNTYPTYTNLITSDFLENGSEQCLFLENNELDNSSWCLSDLKEICYTSAERVSVCEPSTVLSGIEATIKALTQKCQIEEISLHEEELRFQQRNKYIDEIFNRQKHELGDKVSPNKVCPQTNMIPYITTVNSGHPTSTCIVGDTLDDINVNVIDIWQRTWNRLWCIGINLVCNTKRSVMGWAEIILQESMTNNIVIKSNREIIPGSKHLINPCTKDPFLKGSTHGPVEGLDGSGDRIRPVLCESCSVSNISNTLSDKNNDTLKARISNLKQCDKCGRTKPNFTQKSSRQTLTCIMNLPSFSNVETVTGHIILNYKFLPQFDVDDAVDDLMDLNEDSLRLVSAMGSHNEGGVSAMGADQRGGVSVAGSDNEGGVSPKDSNKRGRVCDLDSDKKGGVSNLDADKESGVRGGVNCKMVDDSERIFTKDCGTIRLNVSDILEGKYELTCNIDDTSEDIDMDDLKDIHHDRLAWQRVYKHHDVEIISDHSTQCRLEYVLTEKCKYIYQEKFDWFISSSPYKTLCNVKIRLHEKKARDRRSLTIYTCTDEELFLAVHQLYSYLPDSTVILPKKQSQNAKQTKCLIALQKEARFLHSGLKELLSDQDHEMKGSSDTDEDESDLRKVGEKFKRNRQAVVQKQDKIMTSDKIKHFKDQYRTIQVSSDSRVLDLS